MAKTKAFRLVFVTKSSTFKEYMEKRPCWTHTVHVDAGSLFHVVFESYDWRWLEKMGDMIQQSHDDLEEVFLEYAGRLRRE